jgi:DNA-binding transcriptional ArsR family regulator
MDHTPLIHTFEQVDAQIVDLERILNARGSLPLQETVEHAMLLTKRLIIAYIADGRENLASRIRRAARRIQGAGKKRPIVEHHSRQLPRAGLLPQLSEHGTQRRAAAASGKNGGAHPASHLFIHENTLHA